MPEWTEFECEFGVSAILACSGIVMRRSFESNPDSNTGIVIVMMRTEDLEFEVTEGSIDLSGRIRGNLGR